MSQSKALEILHGAIKTPPIAEHARVQIGQHLRTLQDGDTIPMPHSRSMPSVGPRCHELRVRGGDVTWRVLYRIDPRAIVVVDVCGSQAR